MVCGGDGGFEGLEVEGAKIDDVGQGGYAGLKKTVSVELDGGGGRELRMREGREGGRLVVVDKGLKKPSVIIGDATE